MPKLQRVIVEPQENWVQSLISLAMYLAAGVLVYGLAETWTIDWTNGWFYVIVAFWPFYLIWLVIKWGFIGFLVGLGVFFGISAAYIGYCKLVGKKPRALW
jgi:hypothetical protein